jgi:putative glutathione S-transferase
MGMLIDGRWRDDADRTMQNGAYRGETSALPSRLEPEVLAAIKQTPERFVLVVSSSCPWSHGAMLAWQLKGYADRMPLQMAGGPRVEGYAVAPDGPLSAGFCHVHRLYTLTDKTYTGRATVPVLWDAHERSVRSNSSDDIMRAFDTTGTGPRLFPTDLADAMELFLPQLFSGLSNAVYRAGKAQRQDEYEDATRSVYAMLHTLEERLSGQTYLFGDAITAADLRLFATLVRYDTVYATHFRCTRYRLTDFPALWRFTRRIFQMPGVTETVDFDEIRRGYYLNDGSHNPFGLIADQPEIHWLDRSDL